MLDLAEYVLETKGAVSALYGHRSQAPTSTSWKSVFALCWKAAMSAMGFFASLPLDGALFVSLASGTASARARPSTIRRSQRSAHLTSQRPCGASSLCPFQALARPSRGGPSCGRAAPSHPATAPSSPRARHPRSARSHAHARARARGRSRWGSAAAPASPACAAAAPPGGPKLLLLAGVPAEEGQERVVEELPLAELERRRGRHGWGGVGSVRGLDLCAAVVGRRGGDQGRCAPLRSPPQGLPCHCTFRIKSPQITPRGYLPPFSADHFRAPQR